MKPLPLLSSLCVFALIGAFALISKNGNSHTAEGEGPSQAPLPPRNEDYENPLPLPEPVILTEDLVPSHDLVHFVEKELTLKFEPPLAFTPTSAEKIITSVHEGIGNYLTTEQSKEFNILCNKLGVLPSFAPLDHTLTTILAAEVRGLITPNQSLIIETFDATSPPEQAALVNLLAQRLLLQKIGFPQPGDSIDRSLTRHFIVQTLALAVERKFRATLPEYEPSLNENMRESIFVGLPSFFYELATFSEFHLLERFQTAPPAQALPSLAKLTTGREVLSHPFTASPSESNFQLGAIPLYLIIIESADPSTARTLANTLQSDSYELSSTGLKWTLSFSSEKSPPRVAEFLRSYYSLRDTERTVAIVIDGNQLHVTNSTQTGLPVQPLGPGLFPSKILE